MNRYRCTHTVEAIQWDDSDEQREACAEWFEKHGVMFETRGPIVILPEGGELQVGEWIVLMEGEESVDFVGMDDETFRETYEDAR